MYTPNNVATISDMRLKPKTLLKKAEENPVFMFYHSKPKAVILSIDDYQIIQDELEDYALSLEAIKYEKEDKGKIKWHTLEEIKASINKEPKNKCSK